MRAAPCARQSATHEVHAVGKTRMHVPAQVARPSRFRQALGGRAGGDIAGEDDGGVDCAFPIATRGAPPRPNLRVAGFSEHHAFRTVDGRGHFSRSPRALRAASGRGMLSRGLSPVRSTSAARTASSMCGYPLPRPRNGVQRDIGCAACRRYRHEHRSRIEDTIESEEGVRQRGIVVAVGGIEKNRSVYGAAIGASFV